MSYTFKYNKQKGTYEVMKDKKLDKECRTMQEAKTYIDSRTGESLAPPKQHANNSNKKKDPVVGFGEWGVPRFLMKADSGKYETDNQKE